MSDTVLAGILALMLSIGWDDAPQVPTAPLSCWIEPKTTGADEPICGPTALAPLDSYGWTSYPTQ